MPFVPGLAGGVIAVDSRGVVIGIAPASNVLTSPTYGQAVQFGNVHGSFTFAGSGAPPDIYAPVVVYQQFGTNGVAADVLKTTQGEFGATVYYGRTTDDSMEGFSWFVAAKQNTAGAYTQANPITPIEGHSQVEGANHATGNVTGIAGRVSARNTSIVDTAHLVYAGLMEIDVGATVTEYVAFYEDAVNAAPAANNWTLKGVNDLRVGGFEGPASYYANDPVAAMLGMQTQNFALALQAASSALTQGTVYLVGVPYRKGQVATNVRFGVAAAAAGAAPTSMVCGLADSTGKMLAQSGELKASAIWTSPTAYADAPLAGAYTILSSGLYYHVILQVGAFGVTQPTFYRGSGSPIATAEVKTGATTGQTALPANGATVVGGLSAAGALRFWAASI